MQMFSRVCVLVFLGVAFLFASGTVNVHAQVPALRISSDTGFLRVYAVGDAVSVVFIATDADRDPVVGAILTITHSGLTDVTISNGGATDVTGRVTVTGTIVDIGVYIEAVWSDERLMARGDFEVVDSGISPATIVVNPPDPKYPLTVGDTFTQTISIENRFERFATLPLSAWQMDVVFDPLMLELVAVTEGDFLERSGEDAFFAVKILSGKIRVTQDRTGQIANADPRFPNVVKAASPPGILLWPGDRGTLITIEFRVLAFGEGSLGIYNVRLASSVDDNEDGIEDRLSYDILVEGGFVAAPVSPVREYDGFITVPEFPGGNVNRIFDTYLMTFRHSDVHEHFPDVLRAFKNPEVQSVLNPVVINHFVREPEYIRAFYPAVDESIITLLTTDNEFRTLFGDETFQGILQDPTDIDELISLIEAQPQRDPEMLTIVSGNFQEGEFQTALGNPLVVLVRDQYGAPLSGVEVAFRVTRGGGRLSRPRVQTNSTGRAETTLTLASDGIHQVEASVVGFPALTQTFTAAATAVCEVPPPPPEPEPSRATTLSIVSGSNQLGGMGKPLVQPFVVGVLDQDGKPLQRTLVTFTITAGNGRLSATIQNTDVYGQARTTLTLGSRAGRNSVVVRAAGITQTQTFTATAIAPPPPPNPELVVPVPPSTAEPDQQLPPVVYWIEDGTIFRLDGGNKQALVEPLEGWTVTSLAMDMAKNILYWTERQTGKQIGRIWSGDLNDRNARELQRIVAAPEGIVVDAENDKLYWTNDRGKIQSINVDGKNFKGNLITNLGSPKHITLDSATGDIYWTVDNGDGSWSIWSAPLNGNIIREEIVGLGQLGGIAVADDKVYWTEEVEGNQGKISTAYKNGSGVKTLFYAPGRVPLGLAIDEVGRRLYWTDNGGSIRSLNLDNPIETEIVVEGLDAPAVAIALGRSSGESVPASPAAPSMIAERSVESALLANYPNPFNPETWIPYQLAKAADVTLMIYDVRGGVIRTLAIGHQPVGIYQSKSRAAYWDGRNEIGEPVASGVYFYTLTAGEFNATRKMIIRK